ncbi:hypothetical protein A9Q93_11755 [Nonlabens dokdonensis]|uniref:Transporter n=1 Tax=Nonlabens dokdonensis TaxID=328515 RepID=A0A1Z8ALI2_9FLAO|nr:transporter [Nonlabens dokdonensis]OUS11206.1 hypothetical protein A9Q93_11755 [Nonlabens dokdonensis]
MNYSFNTIRLFFVLFVTSQFVNGQYTETINTNNPGRSQGAFAVGKGVAQVEGSLFYRTEEHDLQRYERDYIGTSFQLRYGAVTERLEFSLFGNYSRVNQSDFNGLVSTESEFGNFSRFTVGGKYLVFDPLVFFGEKKVNLLSWKANNRLSWRDLIPAVSVYAGANLDLSENNVLTPPDNSTISPRFELITQNNWGRWVFVTNIIADRVGTDFPSYQWILTMTHSINGKWAVFGEYQGLKSDFYSDDLARGGLTYLITKDWQVDSSATVNFKDTPTVFQVNLGMSYRLDFHKDEAIKQTDDFKGTGKKKKNKKNKLNLEEENDGR